MDVAVWLRGLGLTKYEAIFRENDIDEAVLPSLTHENLKELGVASFGHRVKLLDAIAALCSNVSGKAPSVDTATTSSAQSTRPEDRAERRQVTVMFSDLVGSTALSARVDPEDLRGAESAAHAGGRCCSFVEYRGPSKLACLADGAARQARPGEGNGADWISDWERVLSCAASISGTQG
jgi:hypothetical protein